jgi:molybdate transport system permease protein
MATADIATNSPKDLNGLPVRRVGSDVPFYVALGMIGATYVFFLIGLLVADVAYMVDSPSADKTPLWSAIEWARPALRPVLPIIAALGKPEIRYSVKLTMISCLFTSILSLLVAVPIGYLLSRFRFPGRNLLDAILDVPIVLPPLVVGLSLLILFQFWPFSATARWVVFQIPAVILAQFMVAAAFAVRIMRATFDQIDKRHENVALTLGCTRAQAFGLVVLPQARQGMLTAGTLAWARALGEFGPLLIFAGATRNKTEVLSTTVFLELSIGNLEAAVAVSLIMVGAAVSVLVVARAWGSRDLSL